MTRTRATAFALAAILFAIPAATARADFSEVVAAIEAKGGRHKTVIPLFGLVRMMIWIAHPEGVHDLQLATWEGRKFSIDGPEIEPLLRAKAGAGYRPMVATRFRNGEWTYIYARPARGDLMEMLLVTHDRSDTTVLRALIEPHRLAEEMNDPHHHGHVQIAWR
jgi:hypothetical protein